MQKSMTVAMLTYTARRRGMSPLLMARSRVNGDQKFAVSSTALCPKQRRVIRIQSANQNREG
jgi:hypothetical protein